MTLASLQTAYPDFVPNQVLTDAQLNQLRDYLDGQTRLGRLRTIGQGIACGLTVATGSVDGAFALVVQGGYGLTSDGFLIELGADEAGGEVAFGATAFTRVVDYTDPMTATSPGGDGAAPTGPAYEPWQTGDGTDQIPLLRLLGADEDLNDPEASPEALTAGHLDGRVVVLYLERAPETLDGCFVTTCDNRGRRVQHTVRVLLANAAEVAGAPSPGAPSPPPARARVPRIQAVLDGAGADLTKLESAEHLLAVTREAAQIAAERVGKTFDETARRYGPALDLDEGQIEEALQAIDGALDAEEVSSFLVLDHLRHLADAVAAFGRAACEAVGGCGPVGGYGRHLLLGRTDGEDGHRHLFLPAPTLRAPAGALPRAQRSFQRASALASAFDPKRVSDLDRVQAAASQTARWPLGTRAIPAYYDAKALAELWSDSPCDPHPVRQSGTTFEVEDEDGGLGTAYADVSLVRLEGHLGREVTEVTKEIHELRRRLGLEFSLVVAHFGDAPDVEEAVPFFDLVEAQPGVEPVGGVEPGGTFVLVTEKAAVVADFGLRCCGRRAVVAVEEGPTTGTIVVTVLHEGAPLAGVSVHLSRVVDGSPEIEEIRSTDSEGVVRFAEIAPGTFTLRATRTGFQAGEATGVQLGAGATRPVAIDLEAEVATGFVQVLYCPDPKVTHEVLIDRKVVVPVDGGGSGLVEIEAGDHTIGVAPEGGFFPNFGKLSLKMEAPFEVQAGQVTTLFVTRNREGAPTIEAEVGPVPKGIGGQEVAVRVYHSAFGRGSVTVSMKEAGLVLTEGLRPGGVTEAVAAPAVNDQLVVEGEKGTTQYVLPLATLGGRPLTILLCDDAVHYVLSDGEGFQAPVVQGRGAQHTPAVDLDIAVDIEQDKRDVLDLRAKRRQKEVAEAAKAADVTGTQTYQKAIEFIEGTATRSDISSKDLALAYGEVVGQLESTLKQTPPAKRPAYQALLEATVHGYLDRAARYPGGGGAATQVELDRIEETLVQNGISAAGARARWNADELTGALGPDVVLPRF